ncbi:hypothetical protein ACFYO9_07885 [Streptomyces sp. NPDC005863]|uniref:hypothetical protein n=1 Tax=unclassified Streptomyces TaxID=2593676 RepID=UPI0033E42530
MELSGIAALLALAGIPVTVVVARWQKRTALEQAEAAHHTAIEVAEANHRAAMEQAQANHRTALSVAEAAQQTALELEAATHRNALRLAQKQAETEQERLRWQVRQTTYTQFQSAIDRLRRAVLAEEVMSDEMKDAYHDIHEFHHVLGMVAGAEVRGLAWSIKLGAEGVMDSVHGLPSEARAELWREVISPRRAQLDEVINRELDRPFRPDSPGARSRTGRDAGSI